MAFEQTPVKTPASIDADELDLLSRLICGEMGMSWAPDEQQLYVGSVALNRVASDRFPDTLEEVVYQPGQYACASYLDTLTPDERTVANARQLLEGGSVLPAGVVFQSEAPQGSGVYATYHDEVLGSTTYYCTLEG
ncbi:MAG: cell wall hydrolase [Oscillospiraceae bacterium]|nr:cell wall hydrolase [Oscillospiraceae bacterium]